MGSLSLSNCAFEPSQIRSLIRSRNSKILFWNTFHLSFHHLLNYLIYISTFVINGDSCGVVLFSRAIDAH